MLRKFAWRFLLLAVATALILPVTYSAMGGKPSGGSSLPPVRYQVQFWTMVGAAPDWPLFAVFDANGSCQTVGYCYVDQNGDGTGDVPHGFFYDPNVNQNYAVDLNTIVLGIPEGTYIRGGTAINNAGQIAVYIAPDPTPNPLNGLQAGVVDMNQNPPVLHLVPDRSFTSYSVPGDINDVGDMVVRYHNADGTVGNYAINYNIAAGITAPQFFASNTSDVTPYINNNRDVVGLYASGDAFRLNLIGGTPEIFPGLAPRGINESSAFCGSATVSLKGNKTTSYAFVYDSSQHLYSDLLRAIDLNGSEDFLGGVYLHHQKYGTLDLRSLLDSRDPDSAVIASGGSLNPYVILERDPVTSFPIIAGYYNFNDATGSAVGVILTPVPAP